MAKKRKTLKKAPYVLITDVSIGGKIHKKGSTVKLTEKGAEYFKSKFYIK